MSEDRLLGATLWIRRVLVRSQEGQSEARCDDESFRASCVFGACKRFGSVRQESLFRPASYRHLARCSEGALDGVVSAPQTPAAIRNGRAPCLDKWKSVRKGAWRVWPPHQTLDADLLARPRPASLTLTRGERRFLSPAPSLTRFPEGWVVCSCRVMAELREARAGHVSCPVQDMAAVGGCVSSIKRSGRGNEPWPHVG